MSIGFTPFPKEGVESMDLVVTGVFGDKTDWVGSALTQLQKSQPDPPADGLGPADAVVAARTALPPTTYGVVAKVHRTAAGAETLPVEDRRLVTLTPPNTDILVRFSERDGLTRVDRLHSTAERVRNVLAFCVGGPVPLAVRMTSRQYHTYARMDLAANLNPPREAVHGDDAAAQAWYGAIEGQYAAAKRILVDGPPPEPVARALSLVGEAICSTDVEERFFYAWRALEVLGHWDLKTSRARGLAGTPAAVEPYLQLIAEPILNRQFARLDADRLVVVTIARRGLGMTPERVKELYELRTAIAHGSVTTETHVRILKAGRELVEVAHAAVAATLDTADLLAP